jgi:hypothetical protein
MPGKKAHQRVTPNVVATTPTMSTCRGDKPRKLLSTSGAGEGGEGGREEEISTSVAGGIPAEENKYA